MLPAPKSIRTSNGGESAKQQWRKRKAGAEPYEGPIKRRASCHKLPQYYLRFYPLRQTADDDLVLQMLHEIVINWRSLDKNNRRTSEPGCWKCDFKAHARSSICVGRIRTSSGLDCRQTRNGASVVRLTSSVQKRVMSGF